MKKLLLFATIILLFSGCGLFESSHEMEKNAEELAFEGSSAFISKNYKEAVNAYTDLKDWYPFSKYAILAELKIADAYYHLKSYDEAILAYEAFEKMHPKNDAIPYVIYQTGLCWFNQLDMIDRDHMPARNSMAQFNRLIDQYPASQYAQKANDHIQKGMENLSGHELYVADFYFKTKQYAAALKRYEYLVEHYPNSKESKKALNKIMECGALIKGN
jgi:outer membrane protein assembly factor BamD